ncbi:MAG: hypothetical protein ACRDPQ_15845 [Nocardioidaceae bacterium]
MNSVIASNLVLTTGSAGEDPDIVISRSADRLHPVSREALAEHVGDIRLIEPDDIAELPIPPLPLLRAIGPVASTTEEIVAAPTHAWSVILRTPLDAAVSANYAARAAAALLADHVDGIGIDLAIPRVWPQLHPDADPARTADWFVFERESDDKHVATTTRGMSRFGLPELAVVEVEPTEVPAWDAILTGVARRLLSVDPTDLPDQVELGLRDIADGYAEPVDPDDPTLQRRTTVDLAYGGEIAEVTGPAVADLFIG